MSLCLSSGRFLDPRTAHTEGASPMAKSDTRVIVKLRSTEGTGSTYTTTKNRSTQRERMELRKYDPVLRRHVLFRETR